MKSQQLPALSALFDGELEFHEAQRVVSAAVREDELRAAWRMYALISDHLRQEGAIAPTPDFTSAVMAKLQEEPVVLAPGNVRPTARQHPLWALAASVAGVAVVGWLALSGDFESAPRNRGIATAPPASSFVPAVVTAHAPRMATAASLPARADMSEYLLAHHIQAASFRLGDSTEHVRSVAIGGGTDRP